MTARHLLSLMDLTSDEIRQIVSRANEIKSLPQSDPTSSLMRNQTSVMVFEKSSTRTRVSFEAGVARFGGSSIFLAPSDSHLGRGEPIEDTARVLSRMSSLIVMRTGPHERIENMAAHATVPVINGLSDFNHPCQLLADIQTFTEHRGNIQGKKIAWIGDGNNVCHSWINAARQLQFELHIATPIDHQPDPTLIGLCENNIVLTEDPKAAAKNAALIVTDTWSGMGYEKEKNEREKIFSNYCVDNKLMKMAADDALFMHCLPAYRGSEVTAEVIDGPQSIVWDEAENRLYAQMALMEFLLSGNDKSHH